MKDLARISKEISFIPFVNCQCQYVSLLCMAVGSSISLCLHFHAADKKLIF